MFDIVIVGSGPAGLTAGIYSCRANKKVAVIEGANLGGQLMKTTEIENYPGFSKAIFGPDLMLEMYTQTKNLKAKMIKDSLVDFQKTKNVFEIMLQKEKILTKSIIIATGASPIMLGIEEKFLGLGVSTCATCDGAFFKDKNVSVIGGGNTALEESLYLSNIVNKLYLINRRNEFRADSILQDRVKNKSNIKILTPYEVIEFLGENTLKKIKIKNKETSETKTLEVDGAFIAIGYNPNTAFLSKKIELNENGYVKKEIITEIPGLFVAGEIHDFKYRQAITAAGYGCMAALEAIKFIESQ